MRSELPESTLRDLYPTLSDEERAEVEAALDRYVALVLSIVEERSTGSPLTTAEEILYAGSHEGRDLSRARQSSLSRLIISRSLRSGHDQA